MKRLRFSHVLRRISCRLGHFINFCFFPAPRRQDGIHAGADGTCMKATAMAYTMSACPPQLPRRGALRQSVACAGNDWFSLRDRTGDV